MLKVTVLINWWLKRPCGAVDLPKRLVTQRPSIERTKARSCVGTHTLDSNVEIDDNCRIDTTSCGFDVGFPGSNFIQHIQEWRSQKIPTELANLGSRGALLIKYPETVALPGDKVDEYSSFYLKDTDLHSGVEWPFEDTQTTKQCTSK